MDVIYWIAAGLCIFCIVMSIRLIFDVKDLIKCFKDEDKRGKIISVIVSVLALAGAVFFGGMAVYRLVELYFLACG